MNRPDSLARARDMPAVGNETTEQGTDWCRQGNRVRIPGVEDVPHGVSCFGLSIRNRFSHEASKEAENKMVPRWVYWSVAALVSYGTWAVLSKLIGGSLSPSHGQALSTLGMLPLIVFLTVSKGPVNPGNWWRGVLAATAGGTISCLGNIPFFNALSSAKATAVVPITALYPVVTVLLAVTLLKERLGKFQVIGIALSLAAVYLLTVRLERGLLSPWLPLAILPVVLWGAAGLLQKVSTSDLAVRNSAAWFLAAFVLVGLILLVRQPLNRESPGTSGSPRRSSALRSPSAITRSRWPMQAKARRRSSHRWSACTRWSASRRRCCSLERPSAGASRSVPCWH